MKKEKNSVYNYFFWIILIIILIIISLIIKNIYNDQILTWDINVNNFINNNLRSEFLIKIAKIITEFGSAIVLITISILSLIVLKNKRSAFLITTNLLFVFIFNRVLKYIIRRPRPEHMLITESGYSFPSGHAMVSTAFYGYLIYLIYKNVKNKALKFSLCFFVGFLIVLIGFSRVYLGVHYLSDVIGGFLIAILYLMIFIRVCKASKMEMF